MSNEINSEGQDVKIKEGTGMNQHMEERDKLRKERAKYELVWGRDPWIKCMFRAVGKLLMDMMSRSFALFVATSYFTIDFINTEGKIPSWMELAAVLLLPAVFGLFWMEKVNGKQLLEALISRLKFGKIEHTPVSKDV